MRKLFAIDSRSLAAFRVAISIVLLADLAIRAADLGAMYTDDGMFSRSIICRYYTSIWNWSFHFGSGSWLYQAVLFGLAALFAIALFIGYETRLATVASWLMLVSLQNRVPPILHGADNLVRMLLFWGMFLPLGAVWSVDARLAKRKGIRRGSVQSVLSVASAAILLQMAFMYLFSAVFKSNASWFYGTAIAETLPHDFFGTPLGLKLLAFPSVLTVLTIDVFALEWLGPLLLFSPIRTAQVRLVVTGLLASMHAGIAMLLNVGLFSYASIGGLLLFLPAVFWDKLLGRLGSIADNLGQPETAEAVSPTTAQSAVSFAAQSVCAVALAFVIFVNLNGLPSRFVPWTPLRMEFLTIACGLGQTWNMFAAAPNRNGWYVARATLVDDSRVDLLQHGAPVVWDRPQNPAAVYPNDRWLKCFREMSYADEMGFQVFRQPVAEYLCRDWNHKQPADKQISDFALVFCMEGKNPYGGSDPVTIRETFVHLDFAARDDEDQR